MDSPRLTAGYHAPPLEASPALQALMGTHVGCMVSWMLFIFPKHIPMEGAITCSNPVLPPALQLHCAPDFALSVQPGCSCSDHHDSE